MPKLRLPSVAETCTVLSWACLCLTSLVMGISAHLYLGVLWALLGNRDWPVSTDLYLSSVRWFPIVPAVAGLGIWILWQRGDLPKTAPIVVTALHFLSLSLIAFSIFAAAKPLLEMTWKMSGQT